MTYATSWPALTRSSRPSLGSLRLPSSMPLPRSMSAALCPPSLKADLPCGLRPTFWTVERRPPWADCSITETMGWSMPSSSVVCFMNALPPEEWALFRSDTEHMSPVRVTTSWTFGIWLHRSRITIPRDRKFTFVWPLLRTSHASSSRRWTYRSGLVSFECEASAWHWVTLSESLRSCVVSWCILYDAKSYWCWEFQYRCPVQPDRSHRGISSKLPLLCESCRQHAGTVAPASAARYRSWPLWLWQSEPERHGWCSAHQVSGLAVCCLVSELLRWLRFNGAEVYIRDRSRLDSILVFLYSDGAWIWDFSVTMYDLLRRMRK